MLWKHGTAGSTEYMDIKQKSWYYQTNFVYSVRLILGVASQISLFCKTPSLSSKSPDKETSREQGLDDEDTYDKAELIVIVDKGYKRLVNYIRVANLKEKTQNGVLAKADKRLI